MVVSLSPNHKLASLVLILYNVSPVFVIARNVVTKQSIFSPSIYRVGFLFTLLAPCIAGGYLAPRFTSPFVWRACLAGKLIMEKTELLKIIV